MASTADRIEKKVLLRAPVSRVWQAISDSARFGAWFGVRFDGPFVPGARMVGRIVPTTVDPAIAKEQAKYEGKAFEIVVGDVEPERLLSYRWHPYAVDEGRDYANEPMTTVTFELSPAPEGTLLTVTESGFEALPPERRAEAFRMNEGGWSAQVELVAKFLAHEA
jgi:uncharacterized protein YndB with AHSA1/START domain